MNRISIDVPEHLPFKVVIPVRITDINYGNHVGNQVFLELMQEARTQWLRQMGYGELNFETSGLIMADAAIEFRSELLYGDKAEIQIGVTGISRVGFDIIYLISCERNGIQITVARAKTGMVCYNYQAKKVSQIPGVAKEKISAFLVNQ